MFDWFTRLLSALGPFGVFLLTLAENVFPPIPSEVVLPLAGYVAFQGDGPLLVTIVAGTFGSVAGAMFWYYLGRCIGIDRFKRFAERHGRWLTLTPAEVDRVDRWFDRHGQWAVLFGRLVPGVRTLISVPAGVTGMKLTSFLVYSTIGSALWTTLLVLAGYELGENYSLVERVIEPASNLVLVIVITLYFWRVATFRRSNR